MQSLRVAAAVLMLAASCLGIEIAGSQENVVQVPEHSLVKINGNPDQFLWVLPWHGPWTEPPKIELYPGATPGHVAFTGPPGTYAVLWGDTLGQGQSYVEIISGEPSPPPNPPDPPEPPEPPTPPSPRPDGFAGQIYDLAKPINDPAGANKIISIHRTVASKIRAGGILSVIQADTELFNAQKAVQLTTAWKPVAEASAIRREEIVGDRSSTKDTYADYCEAVVEGLEAAYPDE